MAQLIIAAAASYVGGAIGASVGAAALGSQIGFLVGSFIGSALFQKKQTTSGPRLGDTTFQGVSEGSPIPDVKGTFRTAGTIVWMKDNRLQETRHEQDAGKGGMFGGGGGSSEWYTYAMNIAVVIAEGEIDGVRRIWGDGKLMFSIAVGATPATFKANTARGAITIYTGSTTQTADPTIAAALGAANTPAFRRSAYVVFTDYQLADFANHVPNLEFEVVESGATSYPYKREVISGKTIWSAVPDTRRLAQVGISQQPVAGGSVYRWALGDDAPVAIATLSTGWGGIYDGTILYDVAEDQYVVITGSSGGIGKVYYEVFDAATGASLTGWRELFPNDLIAAGGLRNWAGNVEIGGVTNPYGWAWDPIERQVIGFATGFSSGDLYRLRISPMGGGCQIDLFAAAGFAAGGSWRRGYVDAQGGVWTVDSTIYVRVAPAPLMVASATTLNEGHEFLWAARQEIWTPTGGGSDWEVFDLSDQATITAGSALIGALSGGSYYAGVENSKGQAWFLKNGATGYIDGLLVNADLTIARTVTGIQATDGLRDAYDALPGVIAANHFGMNFQCFYEDALEPGTITLEDALTEYCAEVGVVPNAADHSADVVRGCCRAHPMTVRQAIEPLLAAYGSDPVDSDGTVKFVKRGAASVLALDEDEMGARASDDEAVEPWTLTEALETELPVELTVQFRNVDTDWLEAAAVKVRANAGNANEKTFVEMPIGFTSEEANRLAGALMRQAWMERKTYAFQLGPEHSALEPTDVVTLPDGSRVRITRIIEEPSGVLKCEAAGDDDGALTGYEVGNSGDPAETITLDTGGPTTLAVLDCALLRDVDDDEGRYVGACGQDANWPSAVAFQSTDGGTTYMPRIALTSAARIGRVTAGFMCDARWQARGWDHESVITVRLVQSGLTLSAPASVASFYNGAGAFLISTDGENWELAQAYTVTANGDGTYTLQDMLRARRGTDHSAGPFRAGAQVVFVDADNPRIARLPAALAEIDTDSLWKGVTLGASIVDELARSHSFACVSAKPNSPVAIGGAKDPATGDIAIFWTRRVRKDQDWRSGGGQALDEPTEAYTLGIYDEGFGELKRTITVSPDTSYTYTAAMQTADFGGSTDVVGARIALVSSRVGDGFPGAAPVGDLYPPVEWDAAALTGGFALSEANRKVTRSGADVSNAPANRGYATGKFYWEYELAGTVGADMFFGIASSAAGTSYWRLRGGSSVSASGASDMGERIPSNGASGDVYMFAVDFTAGSLWLGYNGAWLAGEPSTALRPHATFTPAAGWRPFVWSSDSGESFSVRASFVAGNQYPLPDGFTPLR